MTVSGRYVSTFAEASHALALGMHMNSDYPFMIARVKSVDANKVTIVGSCGEERECFIKRRKRLTEFVTVEQSSNYERLFGLRPSRWELAPFKDDRTPAPGQEALLSGKADYSGRNEAVELFRGGSQGT